MSVAKRLFRKLTLLLNPNALMTWVIPNGFRFSCLLASGTARMKIIQGEIETTERAFVGSVLQDGDIFLDIGANYGLFTLEAAKVVGSGGQVIAFEPSTREAKILHHNIQQNNLTNVVHIGLALSDVCGTARFGVATDGGLNSLAENKHQEQIIQSWDEVPTSTLDAWLETQPHLNTVRLIKMDVEGAECKVIQGANRLLTHQAPMLLCEVCDATLAGFQNTGKALYTTLQSYGYQMFEFAPDGTLLPSVIRTHYDAINLVAIKHTEDIKQFVEARR